MSSLVVMLALFAGCFGKAPELKIELQAPAEIPGGSEFQVTWTGPDSVGDYITIVPAGSPEGDWAEYAYTTAGNPITLHAPYATGQYEIRYATEKTTPDSTLGRVSISVTAVQASVSAPESVPAGGSFEVQWTGPANPDCYIYIVPDGSPEGDWTESEWYYVSTGNPIIFNAPMAPGLYEIRFATETTEPDSTLARCPVNVGNGLISVEAPPEIGAGMSFMVTWTGPGAEGDYLVLVSAGTAEGDWVGWEWHYVTDANPLNFVAPQEPGAYEIRYATEITDPDQTLGMATITVI